MTLLTKDQAKALVEKTYTDDIQEVLSWIEEQARAGKTLLHLYKPLKENTRKQLENLGYDIPPMPSICIQKGGLYHTIHWA